MGSDYYGSLIQEPPQDSDRYEIRESKLKPGEKGYYLVEVPGVKDLEFDQFLVSAEIVSQVTEKEASALKEAAKDYSDKISKLMEKWMDDLRVANSTARIALSPIVAMLQEDKRQFAAIEPPAMSEVQSVAIGIEGGMENVIEGFLEFMAENDTKASTMVTAGLKLITENIAKLNELINLP